jgi:CheY-like chemotaxis protein
MSDHDVPEPDKTKGTKDKNQLKPPENGAVAASHAVKSLVEAFTALGKLALIAVVLIFLWSNRTPVENYVTQWLDSANKVTLPGFSIERQVSAEKTIAEIKIKKGSLVDTELARGAITRASRNALAITGARILWVDDRPDNNKLERQVLETIGIEVFLAEDTKEALVLLPRVRPDLIISDIIRENDKAQPLKNCPAHYFQVPAGMDADLAKINKDLLEGQSKATGFSTAEAISITSTASDYTDHASPRIIFYAASAGTISASQCARLVTNRPAVLLNSVVSALEESRWEKLRKQPLAEKEPIAEKKEQFETR